MFVVNFLITVRAKNSNHNLFNCTGDQIVRKNIKRLPAQEFLQYVFSGGSEILQLTFWPSYLIVFVSPARDYGYAIRTKVQEPYVNEVSTIYFPVSKR